MTPGKNRTDSSKANSVKVAKLIVFIALGGLVGCLLADFAWYVTPGSWKLRANTRYSLQLILAEEMDGKGNFRDAEATLKTAIQLCPTRYEAYDDLGNLLLSEGRTNAALDQYNTALLYCGNSPTNLLSHDEQLRQREIISEKIRDLEKTEASKAAEKPK